MKWKTLLRSGVNELRSIIEDWRALDGAPVSPCSSCSAGTARSDGSTCSTGDADSVGSAGSVEAVNSVLPAAPIKAANSTESAVSADSAGSASSPVTTSVKATSTVAFSSKSLVKEGLPQHRIISSKYLSRVKIRTLKLVQEELADAIREHEALDAEFVSKRDNLLPIETDVKAELTRRYSPLLQETLNQRNRLQTELDLRQINTLYPVISLEFLRQVKEGRHGLKLPKYAIFDAANSILHAHGRAYEPGKTVTSSDFHYYISPEVVRGFLNFSELEKFGTAYMEKYKEEKLFSVGVSTGVQFTHILPDAVRQFFKEESDKFDQLFFVTEAPDWIVTISDSGLPMTLPNKKISVIAKKDQTCWLIFETEAR